MRIWAELSPMASETIRILAEVNEASPSHVAKVLVERGLMSMASSMEHPDLDPALKEELHRVLTWAEIRRAEFSGKLEKRRITLLKRIENIFRVYSELTFPSGRVGATHEEMTAVLGSYVLEAVALERLPEAQALVDSLLSTYKGGRNGDENR